MNHITDIDTDTIANLDDQSSSTTAAACETMQRYGATPGKNEHDPRDVWDADDAIDALSEAIQLIAANITPDGTQLADEREALLWGVVNTFHAQITRLDRDADKLRPQVDELTHAQDGTEINAHELELKTDQLRNLNDRRDAFEQLRDHAAEHYAHHTANLWRPRTGSHTSFSRKLTAAAIDARDYTRARDTAKTQAHYPAGTLIAFAGAKDVTDTARIFHTLDQAKQKYPDMVLAHGDAPEGAEHIAARWAEQNEVTQIICRPNWKLHGRAAPFRRNDEILKLLPRGVIAFTKKSGITDNLVHGAHSLGIPVHEIKS